MIRKVKHTVPWTYVISYLNGEGIVRTFYEKEYPKTTSIFYGTISKVLVEIQKFNCI